MFLIEEIKIPTFSQEAREGWGNPAYYENGVRSF